jgi:hypothetical protein
MDLIDEIKLLKKQIKKVDEKLNKIIIRLNKINHISSYSSNDSTDDIKYENDSDYD